MKYFLNYNTNPEIQVTRNDILDILYGKSPETVSQALPDNSSSASPYVTVIASNSQVMFLKPEFKLRSLGKSIEPLDEFLSRFNMKTYRTHEEEILETLEIESLLYSLVDNERTTYTGNTCSVILSSRIYGLLGLFLEQLRYAPGLYYVSYTDGFFDDTDLESLERVRLDITGKEISIKAL